MPVLTINGGVAMGAADIFWFSFVPKSKSGLSTISDSKIFEILDGTRWY